MKIYRIMMLGLVLLLSMPAVWAQADRKEQRRIERLEKKMLKEEQRQINKERMLALVESQSFVLEATTIAGRNGRQFQVSPNINFVKIEGKQVVVQTANNVSIGYNGLGGITINGTIQEFKIIEEKNGLTVMIRFSDPVLGPSTLTLNTQEGGGAQARLLGNLGGRVTFQGQLVELEKSRVFQGRSVF